MKADVLARLHLLADGKGTVPRDDLAALLSAYDAQAKALEAARTQVAFLRSCIRSGESLTTEDDAAIDAAIAPIEGQPALVYGAPDDEPFNG